MNNDPVFIDEYAEDWISFMYGYEAQKKDPALRSIFFDRVDPVIIDLLKQYEAGVFDLDQLRDKMISYAKAQDAAKGEMVSVCGGIQADVLPPVLPGK